MVIFGSVGPSKSWGQRRLSDPIFSVLCRMRESPVDQFPAKSKRQLICKVQLLHGHHLPG